MMDAYQRFETLEFCCRTIVNAGKLGKVNYLTDQQVNSYVNHIPKNIAHFMDVDYPSDERALRTEMVNIIRRAYDQGLMISTYGTVSVRWRNDDFLITPRDGPVGISCPATSCRYETAWPKQEDSQPLSGASPTDLSAQPAHQLHYLYSTDQPDGTCRYGPIDVRTIPKAGSSQDVPPSRSG